MLCKNFIIYLKENQIKCVFCDDYKPIILLNLVQHEICFGFVKMSEYHFNENGA